jgi:hypothetical protein
VTEAFSSGRLEDDKVNSFHMFCMINDSHCVHFS